MADVYDEVAGMKRRKAFSRDQVDRVLDRVGSRFLQAERVVIVAAVRRPMAVETEWRHIASVAPEVPPPPRRGDRHVGTMGAAATTAIVAAIAGEVLETYVAASAQVQQYRQAHRSPDPGLVITDLAESAGYGDAVGRQGQQPRGPRRRPLAGRGPADRTGRRFARGLVPVVGVAVGGTMSALSVRKVDELPLRPPAEDEVIRLASDLTHGHGDRYLP